jgi:hypothetical protein
MPEGAVSRQTDYYLFVIALRDLRRAVELVRRSAPKSAWSDIDKAMNAFDTATACGSVDLRDILEHFDDYAEGKGKLQDEHPCLPCVWYEREPDTYRLHLDLGNLLLTVDVRAATQAALALVAATHDAASAVLH